MRHITYFNFAFSIMSCTLKRLCENFIHVMATLWNVGMIKFSFELMSVYMCIHVEFYTCALDIGKKYMRKNQLKKAS